MPRISQHELHRAVDPWVLVTQRRIRQVIDLGGKIDRLSFAMEPLQAQFASAGEVDLRRVARRKIAGAEQHSADGSNVRRDRMSAGEVPLGDEGIDTAGVLPA